MKRSAFTMLVLAITLFAGDCIKWAGKPCDINECSPKAYGIIEQKNTSAYDVVWKNTLNGNMRTSGIPFSEINKFKKITCPK